MSLISSYLNIHESQRELIDLVQSAQNQHDKISVVWDGSVQPAKWSWGAGEIRLHPSLKEDLEKLRFYLIFELCNASRTEEFKAIKASTVDEFVEKVERVEYASLLQTVKIVGSERFPHFQTFKDHYLFQQLNGHSARIAKENFPEKPYAGRVSTLSQQETAVLLVCLQCKLRKDEKRFSQFHPYLPKQFQDLQFS